MSTSVAPVKQECKCGHDRTSHYWEFGAPPLAFIDAPLYAKPAANDCLCMGCPCKKYEGPK